MENTRATIRIHTFQTPISKTGTNDIIPPVILVNLLLDVSVVNSKRKKGAELKPYPSDI